MAFASPSKLSSTKLISDSFDTSFSRSKENQESPSKQLMKSPSKIKIEAKEFAASPSIKSQIKALEQTREQLEDAGKYLDAQKVHEQLLKLKISEESRRRVSVRENKQTQLQTIEEIYEDEMHAVRSHFDAELREFELRVERGLAEMQERHEWALDDYRARAKVTMEEAMKTKFPPSKRLLEMRRSEKALARQHEYRQAHDVKLAADALEKQELVERIERSRAAIQLGEERLKEKLRAELAALEQRNSAVRATILENRRIEETTVTYRYNNKKNDMLSSASRVEVIINRRMEHLSPTKPSNRSRLNLSSSQLNGSLLDE